jgi:hypothetical protein
VYGNFHQNGFWGAPFVIGDEAESPDVASNGAGFMVSWHGWYLSLQFGNATMARAYVNDTWAATETISTSYAETFQPRLASNASGYAISWVQYEGVPPDRHPSAVARIHDGNVWGGVVLLEATSGVVFNSQVASNGEGYGFSWIQYDGSGYSGAASLYGKVYDGTGWTGTALLEDYSGSIYDIQIASDGAGYMTAWRQTGLYVNRYNGAGWTGSAQASSALDLDYIRISSNGSGYAVAWRKYSNATGVYANLFDASGWSEDIPIQVGAVLPSVQIGSDGTGYAVLWIQNDGTSDSLYARTFGRTAWGEALVLENTDSPVYDPFVVGRVGGYSAVWTQADPADPGVKQVLAVLGF